MQPTEDGRVLLVFSRRHSVKIYTEILYLLGVIMHDVFQENENGSVGIGCGYVL